MAEKRKLPVLNRAVPAGGDAEEPRPPWHWVGFGAVLVFAAWLPLAWLAEALKRRIVVTLLGPVESAADIESGMARLAGGKRVAFAAATVGLPALAMILGAIAAGYVVGRHGGTTKARDAGMAGVMSAVVACVLAWVTAGFSPLLLAIAFVLGPAAWIGGWRGVKARKM